MKMFIKGELVALSTGEYSDYCVNGLFRVLRDFDAQSLLTEWARETGRKLEGGFVCDDFRNEQLDYMGWLNKNNYLEDIEYRELHTGSYGYTQLTETVSD